MNLDDSLRSTLTDERRALPGWPDATDRVNAGVRRRRHRRTLAAAVAAVAVGALVAVPTLVFGSGPGGLPAGRPPSPMLTAAPFADLPATPPSPARSTPRPTSRPCTAADLSPQASVIGEIGLGAHHWVIGVHNRGDHPCTLTGWPGLSVATESGGAFQMRFTNDDPAVPGDTPATILPGELAAIRIFNTGSCDSGFTPAGQQNLRFALLLGEDRIPVEPDQWPASCDSVSVSRWYRPWGSTDGGVRLDDAGVSAIIPQPGAVRAGQPIDYEVILINPLARDLLLDPCPVYRQSFGEVDQLLTLNCADGANLLRAHSDLRFTISIPATVAAGRTGLFELHWQLELAGGPTAAAATIVEVTP